MKKPPLVGPFMESMDYLCPKAVIIRRDPHDPRYLGCERPEPRTPRTLETVRLEYQR